MCAQSSLSPTLCDPLDCRLFGPWGSSGKNTGVGSYFLLQGTFLTEGSNLCLLHCGGELSHQGSPYDSLHLLIPNSQSILPLHPSLGSHKSVHWVCFCFVEKFIWRIPRYFTDDEMETQRQIELAQSPTTTIQWQSQDSIPALVQGLTAVEASSPAS